jgi:hypothetical protein
MTMREDRDGDAVLEALFAEARTRRDRPPAALVARVLADAEAARPGGRRLGRFAAIFGALGGWPTAAGLAAASVAGLFLGFAAPDAVGRLGPGASGYDLIDFAPDYPVLADLGG